MHYVAFSQHGEICYLSFNRAVFTILYCFFFGVERAGADCVAAEPPLPAPDHPPPGYAEAAEVSKPTNSSPCDQAEPEMPSSSSSSGMPALPLGIKEQKTQ